LQLSHHIFSNQFSFIHSMQTKPTLLVLAAGMATRYGSLKQLDSFGPKGETIIEYSVYDALQAGFDKIVFVIRQAIAQEFRAAMQQRLPASIQVDYVIQELDMLPAGFEAPEGRVKPWGTAHAVWVAASKIKESFAVINGDDFYGAGSYQLAADFLKNSMYHQEHGLIGYLLKNTLSAHGAVSRGICEVDKDGFLTSVIEYTHIVRTDGGIKALVTDTAAKPLDEEEIVSMNLMAFKPTIFPYLEASLKRFLHQNSMELKAEFYLPMAVNELIGNQVGRVKLLLSPEKWFGVTYPDDKPAVIQNIEQLIQAGQYPEKLWGGF
jgi:NDP-sugar pyrophosphorylase family protein